MLEIISAERARGTLHGVIVQFGGQTPLKLAQALEEAGVPILGTSPDAIDLAEDRDRFQKLLNKCGLRQPRNGLARSVEEARVIVAEIGYPVVIRPSYVLGGRAMEIVRNEPQFERYINQAVVVSGRSPVLIDSYLSDAIEVDVDCISDGTSTHVAGIMEHIEEAGIHSGDSACSLPVHSLSTAMTDELERQTRVARRGAEGRRPDERPVRDQGRRHLRPRGQPAGLADRAVRRQDDRLADRQGRGAGHGRRDGWTRPSPPMAARPGPRSLHHIAVKEAVFPFARFPGVDTLLGPEMRSTGEVMGLDDDYAVAFAKSQLGAGVELPREGTIFVSVRDTDKQRALTPVRRLSELGFRIVATGGTQRFLVDNGIAAEKINKVLEGRPHIEDAIRNRQVQLVLNTTEGAKALSDSRSLRRAALIHKVPYYTTLAGHDRGRRGDRCPAKGQS